ncbi:MAG TPA: carboxypeptidase regulatory-like domain-containing protein [Gemmatimonadaceae bacterium]|jgi:hypothetical protein|nr:carboxypeptidase regulatory-like domain-containing protein [Gemmatimonadaceae bacterium]
MAERETRLRRLAVVLLAGLGSHASAQVVRRVTVRGEAFDSLRGKPLDGASVSILGAARTATADSRGRFVFDTLAPGVYTFVAYHAALDSAGITGLTAKVDVSPGTADVHLAVPSFATLWRVACGDSRPPVDSGFVYGTVRDALSRKPLSGATVELTWTDFSVDSARQIHQKRWHRQTRTDGSGNYGVCGVPMTVVPNIQASNTDGASGVVDLFDVSRVRRRDLTIAGAGDGERRGTVAGVLTDAGGAPFRGARILIADMPEARSAGDGSFAVRDVPAGTRQVDIRSVGMAPYVTAVDVVPHDTVMLAAQLHKITLLDVVRVTGTMTQQRRISALEERKHAGWGYFRDSTTFGQLGTMSSVFGTVPTLQVQPINGTTQFVLTLPQITRRCVANLWIDGVRQITSSDPTIAYGILNDLHPDQIAAIEVYPRGATTPVEFATLNSSCGAVVVWTKWALHP